MPGRPTPATLPLLRPHQLLARWVLGGILVALMGEVSINPFGTAFRFTLGPLTFNLLVLFFPLLHPLPVAITAGLAIVGARVIAAVADTPAAGLALASIIRDFGPEIVAYTVLGAAASLGRVQSRLDRPLSVVGVLAAGDFSTNMVELFVRRFWPDPRAVIMTALIAVARAVVATGIFEVVRASERERRWADERRNYAQRLLFLSKLQSDIFFLRKSAREMEGLMERAHRLYRELRGHSSQQGALDIAKDIHEVKKDYQRTMASLSRLVDVPDLEPVMRFSEVAALVVESNRVYAQTLGKSLSFTLDLNADFSTERFGRWVSILNNLVTNGVEACPGQGAIRIAAHREGERFRLEVSDTGSGIPARDQAHIFAAGFSTKLNPETGSFSSGIGLTHVSELIKSMDGQILVARSDPSGTAFRIEVPWAALRAVTEEG